jgi:uncharacterized protein (TIGR03086 family)
MTENGEWDELLVRHGRAMADFGRRVQGVRRDQWDQPTPDTEWDVRMLVNHVAVEQLWIPPLLGGSTVEQIGDRFDGDQLGSDPVEAWRAAASDARRALEAPDAGERQVHLSYGDTPVADYVSELMADLVIHTWDLAAATGQDDELDAELVELLYAQTLPQVDRLAASGMFAPPVDVDADADVETRLLALTGRSREGWASTG